MIFRRIHQLVWGLAMFGLVLSAFAGKIPDQPRPPEYPSIRPDDPAHEQKEAAYWHADEIYRKKALAWVRTLIAEAQKAETIELITVSPEPIEGRDRRVLYTTDQQHIGGYPIIAQARIRAPAEGKSLLDELAVMIERRPKEMAECFEPRHALRLKINGADYYALICFQCSAARFFSATNDAMLAVEIPIRPESKPFFDQLLISHDLKKAP